LPRLGAPSTHVWVKSVGAGRASRALSTIPFTIYGKGPELSHKHQSTKGHEQQNWHISEAHAEQRNIHVPNIK
ncbi:hypothetical protein GW17_00041852, partial [Ensete ventricosum]